ncbi:MAG TPA: hypothetical protein VEJ36_05860 [Nitrososphaerales archaeon]|nr:hypothetical protein [Nitrososphaerales archaeon]
MPRAQTVIFACLASFLLSLPAVSAMALSPPTTVTFYLEYNGLSKVCPTVGDASLVTTIPPPSSFGLDYCGYFPGPTMVVTSVSTVLYFSASSSGGTGYLYLGSAPETQVAHLTVGSFYASGCTPSTYYLFSGPLTMDLSGQVLTTGEQVRLELANIVKVPGYAFPCTGAIIGGQDTPSALMITGIPVGPSVPLFPLGPLFVLAACLPLILGLRKRNFRSPGR